MSPQDQNVDMIMVDSGSSLSLLDDAIEVVQLTLSEEHRTNFPQDADAILILNELRKAASHTNASNATRLASRRIALFVRTFAPYFHVLDIFTAVKPEWVGCFWGLLLSLHRILNNHSVFLEKFADMLEAVTNLLPAYEQIYNFGRNEIGAAQERIEDKRLTSLISFVYGDLISLFLDIYKVFNRGPTGPRWRLWSFETIPTSQWRPLDSRFAHLEARITQHRRWLENETKSHLQDFSEIQSHRLKYVEFLQRQAEPKGREGGDHDPQRIAKRLKRVDKVKGWLSNNTQSPAESFERSRHSRNLNLCQWFFELEKYRSWKNARPDEDYATDAEALRATWHDRILFVQAQPGYGKTVIAQAVIEDLTAEVEDFDISHEPPSLAHIHINTQQSASTQPDDVLRTLALQLLDCHRHDHATLDAVCLLLRKTSFQEAASPRDVLDVLAVLLQQHPTFLVIDGFEKIASGSEFLAAIAELCRNADSRVILFSRPGISIPLEYQKWASDAPHIASLEEQHNTLSIEQYLTAAFDHLTSQGAFAAPVERALVSDIAQLANGSFLWTSILLKYLQASVLTPDDRTIILQHAHSLQGLDTLYSLILQALESRPVPAKRVIKDVFRWVSHPIHGLCPAALRKAIAVSINAAELEEIFPTTDIIDALPELTCGLISVTGDGVSFIHSSLLEFLQSPASQRSKFSLHDENDVHGHLAARCLLYLAHEVPKRPLCGLSPQIRPMLPSSGASQRTTQSGDSGYKSLSSSDGDNNNLPLPAISPVHHSNGNQARIRTIPFDTNLPFLRYASLCWPIHLSRALAPTHRSRSTTLGDDSLTSVPYLIPLSAFLSSRLAVTAWVEASFRYSLPPTLTRLVGPLSDLKSEISPATVEGKELRIVVHELSLLSDRLMQLKREFSPALRENPSLIWQMDEASAVEYWPVWDGSTGMPR